MSSKVDSQTSSRQEDAVLYIMPQRIQKKMLVDIKNAVNRHRFNILEKFGQDVTHVVTQYSEYEQVMRQLQRDGAEISDDDSDSPSICAEVVALAWLSTCLKAGKILPIEDKYKVKPSQGEQSSRLQAQGREQHLAVPAWACQRVTPLKHHNEKFTKALEILEKHADFRGGDSDYSRALAFRRASCLLKSLPFRVDRLSQVEGLKDIGGHALRVIRNILEDGYCEEVVTVCDVWFSLMELFTSIFGIGPATAKKWIERGWKSLADVRKAADFEPKDDRVIWGMAFHEDLIDPVTRQEADTFTQLVKEEAEALCPGVIVTLTGGFRRGKPEGHDVDILLTHPDEGKEQRLLPALVHALEKKGLILMGRLEATTYDPDVLVSDFKLTPRGMLDHFEKWLGICKFDHSNRTAHGKNSEAEIAGAREGKRFEEQDEEGTRAVGRNEGKALKEEGKTSAAAVTTVGDGESAEKITCASKEKEEPKISAAGTAASDAHSTSSEKTRQGNSDRSPNPEQNLITSTSDHKTNSDDHYVPAMKRHRTTTGLTPSEMAASERTWRARRVDLIVSPWSQYFYALVGWTGNKHFNRDLRLYAQKERNMKLTSHGLFDFTKNTAVPADSEAAVFHNLQLEYRESWERNC